MIPRLETGQSVDIGLPLNGVTREFHCAISEAAEESFTVLRPAEAESPVPVPRGRLRVSTFWGGANWTLSCPVLGVTMREIRLAYPPPDGVERVQRREHLRVAMRVPVGYRPHDEVDPSPLRQGLLLDLSGSGCLLILPEDLPIESLLRIRFEIPDLRVTEVMGKVVRAVPSGSENGSWRFGIHFIELSEYEREAIIKFVFGRHLKEVQRTK